MFQKPTGPFPVPFHVDRRGPKRCDRIFAEMFATKEHENKTMADEWLESKIKYKVSWEEDLHRPECKAVCIRSAPALVLSAECSARL